MTKIISIAEVICFMLLYSTALPCRNTKQEGKERTVCPVMGGKIDKTLFTDYMGKRIFFCCDGCKEKFLESPVKYLGKLNESKSSDNDMLENNQCQ